MLGLHEFISSRWVEVVTFLLVLGRTSGLVIAAPFWGGRVVPGLVRVVVTVCLSIAVYPLVTIAAYPVAGGPAEPSVAFLLLALAGEILLGLALGWAAHLLFAGMRLAGREIGLKMGFGMAQQVDPQQGVETGLFAVLFDIIATLVFFSVNGHHLLVRALISSYSVFPLGGEKPEFARVLLTSAGEIFTIALRVSAPVIVGLFLSNLVLGIMSRAVPQMNVFLVALPLQIVFGLLLIFFSLPVLAAFITNYLSVMSDQMAALSSASGGGG